ncbi:MFS transporter [Acinetobacter bereziniae]|uniref:MFS transporter n=1 Tax=Acinetobacter bereziniae TaxID=106648 RepID=UPI0019016C3E|nr:MFS transporter [Acinetobacter bereziniae]MBJ8421639.1 MFS transporter [Acinetobacter bereziniae]
MSSSTQNQNISPQKFIENQANIIARLERMPVTAKLQFIRIVIGIATFFDAYTVLVIAFAMPQLVQEWNLTPSQIGMIIAAGYIGQFFGAIIFGSLAERFGRMKMMFFTILLFVSMDIACIFAWSGTSMMLFRFLQGIGTGGEVPIASAYINEMIGAEKRGKFFLLYEVIFPVGLMFAGMAGYFLMPLYGWKALFIVGLVPSLLVISLRFFMPESPRWLASKGRFKEADNIVTSFEKAALKAGKSLPTPIIDEDSIKKTEQKKTNWTELFQGIYLKRTLTLWGLWLSVYTVNNGLVTWLPTLYKQHFGLELQTALGYGWFTSAIGVIASIICALMIDRVGRKKWYAFAYLLATVPFICLTTLGATSAKEVLIFATLSYAILQTISFSLYLYTAELYPTRIRAVGLGFSSALLRMGSSIGPMIVAFTISGFGIKYVFSVMACLVLIGGIITILFAIETKGQVLEKLSP